MDFAQQRMQQQDAARMMMYQNSGYQFERRDKKSLIVDVADKSGTDNPLSAAGEFSVDLFEPLIVDKLSDVYLDNFTTYNSLLCDEGNRSSFSLQINEFNVNSNVASSGGGQNMFNRILIPNEHNDVNQAHSSVIHKGKKMNYVCSINPGKLSKITGKITDLAGNSMFSTGNGADGGKLHYAQLTSGASQYVENGSLFGWDDGVVPVSTSTNGTKQFSVAFNTNEGSTDLYFYSNGGVITASTFIATLDSDAEVSQDSATAAGINTTKANTSSYRQGDFPRFTAEFVIVARD